MSSNSLVFKTSGGISSSSAAFLFLIFLCTESSCVNCHSLISNCLLLFGIGPRSPGLLVNTLLIRPMGDIRREIEG